MSDFRSIRPKAVAVKPSSAVTRKRPFGGIEKRRGIRMNSQVRVAVEWVSGGEVRRGEAKTRVVGPYGCLVVLSQRLDVDQHVQVTNLASSQSNPAVVVWRGNERLEGWEFGIELINPEMNFWGLDL
jgi:hypothetical protein